MKAAARASSFALLLVAFLANAEDGAREDRSRDGVLSVAAQLPARGTIRARAGGLATSADAQLTGMAATSLLYGLSSRLAAGVVTQWQPGQFSVMAELRLQLLSQRDAPVDLAASVRVRSVGNEGVGGAVEGRVAIGRSFADLELLAHATLGVGVGGRDDVDLEAAASASVRLGGLFRAGLSARAQGEVVDNLKTDEDLGRPVAVVAGPSLGVRHQRFELQLLVGWSAPRGPGTPGPLAALTGSVDF